MSVPIAAADQLPLFCSEVPFEMYDWETEPGREVEMAVDRRPPVGYFDASAPADFQILGPD
jgi:hypothetical protein